MALLAVFRYNIIILLLLFLEVFTLLTPSHFVKNTFPKSFCENHLGKAHFKPCRPFLPQLSVTKIIDNGKSPKFPSYGKLFNGLLESLSFDLLIKKFHNALSKLASKTFRLLANVIIALSLFFGSPSQSFAAKSALKSTQITSIKGSNSDRKKSSESKAKKGAAVTSERTTSKKDSVKRKNSKQQEENSLAFDELESEELKQKQRKSLLNKVGIALVVVAVSYVVFAPSNDVPTTSRRKSSKPKKMDISKIDEDFNPFDDDFPPPAPQYPLLKKAGNKKLWRQNVEESMPSMSRRLIDDFFTESEKEDLPSENINNQSELQSKDSEDQYNTNTAPPTPAIPPPIPIIGRGRSSSMRLDNSYLEESKKPAQQDKADEDTEEDSISPPLGFIMPAPEESKLPLSNPLDTSPTSPPAPSPPGKKGGGLGLLNRLFQKPGAGRPSEIKQALRSKDTETEDYRRVSAACLAALAPPGAIPELEAEAVSLRGTSLEQMDALIREELVTWGLSEEKAAGAFADVTNAIVVAMVDRAAAVMAQEKVTIIR